jgi:hypothetical protein
LRGIGVLAAWLTAEEPVPVDTVVALIATAAQGCVKAFFVF